MINKIDILKMAKHVFRRTQGTHDRHLMHPRREWAVILLLTIVVVAAGIGASVWRYLTYDQTQVAAENPPETALVYQAEAIDEALVTYAARQQQFEELLAASPAVPATSTNATSTADVFDEVATTTTSATEASTDAESSSVPPAEE